MSPSTCMTRGQYTAPVISRSSGKPSRTTAARLTCTGLAGTGLGSTSNRLNRRDRSNIPQIESHEGSHPHLPLWAHPSGGWPSLVGVLNAADVVEVVDRVVDEVPRERFNGEMGAVAAAAG